MIRICLFFAMSLYSTLAHAQFEQSERVLDRNYLPTRLEQATLQLTASNSVSSSQLTEYKAGKTVLLTPGFQTRPGAIFLASISKLDQRAEVDKVSVTTFPNPVIERTTITYQLAEVGYTTIYISDVNGIQTSRLVDNQLQTAGRHEVIWQADHMPSGTYVCTLETGAKRLSTRIIRK